MKYTKIDNNITKSSFESQNKDFLNENDKYLFIVGKTIGFRKDKKLEKFVGLRNGYSKQLEFTLKSINIDGVEKIKQNASKFSNIKEVDETIIHKIGGIEIYNRVDLSNYKNLIKINDVCENIEITYIINLNGIKVLNNGYKSNNKFIYSDNELEQFVISDEGNDVKMFTIDKPYVFTTNNMMVDIVKHELYEEDGVLYYKKIVEFLSFYLNDNVKLPLYIDANVQFNNTIYYTITKNSSNILLTKNPVSGYNNWDNFLNDFNIGSYTRKTNDIEILNIDNLIPVGDYTKGDIRLSRHIFNFDTSKIFNLGEISITNVIFNFHYFNISGFTNKFILQKCSYLGSIPNINNWNSFSGLPYNISGTNEYKFPNVGTTDTQITISPEDIEKTNSNFILRLYEDYSQDLIINDINFDSDNIKNSSLDIYFTISINEKKTIQFGVSQNDSFGVLESKSSVYLDAISGNTNAVITKVHNSELGTYSNAFGYIYTPNTLLEVEKHKIYRTYFTFDTSILDSYTDVIIRSGYIKFISYAYKRSYVSVLSNKSNQIPTILSDNGSWDYSNYSYVNSYNVSNIGVETIIPINKDLINISGYTNFVLIDYINDYLNDNTDDGVNGIDFNTLKLEIDIEPYLIQGIEYKQVEKGKTFTLNASMNTNNPDLEIRWFSDYILTNHLDTGDSVIFNSNFYENGDKIYAAIYTTTGIRVSVNVLTVLLDIYENKYNKVSIEDRGVYDVGLDDSGLKELNVVNLDEVYFKYQSSISGICYSYVRDLDNIYENNVNVSDGDDLGSYNMYSEFDIIDEFYSNVKDVDVVARMDTIDLKLSYKEIDGFTIHEGTRVLLYSVTPNELDGVYVANYNLKLIKLNETDTADKAFRYKLNVKFGTYLDYEFHTYYYDNTQELPTDPTFNFDIFDSSLYSETVIDMGSYYDRIFDSNV